TSVVTCTTSLQASAQIAFDLLPIPRAGVELLHQAGRASAQPSGHVAPVVLGNFSHRSIELELLDRSENERLLALEGDARAVADHRRAVVLAGHERPQHPQRREADQDGAGHQDAQEKNRRDALAARDEYDRRRAAEAGEEEELPGLKGLVRLKADLTYFA